MIIRPSLGGLSQKNVTPPLDISGMPQARLAFGLRKLRAGYTGYALRARDSSGNEVDVGFTNGKEVTNESLTSGGTTLRAFAGGGNVTVSKWYNQSGNSSTQAGGGSWTGFDTDPDAVQSTSSKQPVLVVSGTKTKLALKFETSGGFSTHGDFLIVDDYRLPNANTGDAFTFAWAGEFQNFDNHMGMVSNVDNFNDGVELIFLEPDGFRFSVDSHDLDTSGSVSSDPEDRIVVLASYDRTRASGQGGDGNSQIIIINGTQSTKDTDEDKHIGASDRFRIGIRKATNSPFDGTIREVIVWESQLSAALQVSLERNMAIYNEADL